MLMQEAILPFGFSLYQPGCVMLFLCLPCPTSVWGSVVVRLFLSVPHLWPLYHPSCIF